MEAVGASSRAAGVGSDARTAPENAVATKKPAMVFLIGIRTVYPTHTCV
jgi:hypothetical protein